MATTPVPFCRRSNPCSASALCRLATIWLAIGTTIAIAGAAAAQDHFRVYPVAAGSGLDGPVVAIDDQFGTQTTDLGAPARFMVPVIKNGEPLFDFFSHLTCYQIVDGVAGPAVISTNQFGAQPLTLGLPDSLCVPTEKLIAPGPISLDHYKCYLASGQSVDAGPVWSDQWNRLEPSTLLYARIQERRTHR